MMRRLPVLWLVWGALACSSPVQPASSLPRPFFRFSASNSVCVRDVAVDATGQGWTGQQCFISATNQYTPPVLAPNRLVSPADLARIEAAFAALPPMSDPACQTAHTPDGTITTLWRGLPGSDTTWVACIDNTTMMLASPYKEAVDLLQMLAGSP